MKVKKVKLVRESLDEDYYREKDLKMMERLLQSEGFDVKLTWQETHAGMDHFAIVDELGLNQLMWIPKGFLKSIDGGLDEWGLCVVDDEEGELVCFEENMGEALDYYMKKLEK